MLIRGATQWDGLADHAQPAMSLRVEDGVITAVGPDQSFGDCPPDLGCDRREVHPSGHSVTRMELRTGEPFWPIRSGLIHSYPPVRSDQSAVRDAYLGLRHPATAMFAFDRPSLYGRHWMRRRA